MRIAILSKDGRVFAACGDGVQVALVDLDRSTHTVRATSYLTQPSRAGDGWSDWLRQQQVETVLARGMLERDRQLLEHAGIQVVVGVPPFRIEPVVARFLAGSLETGVNVCQE